MLRLALVCALVLLIGTDDTVGNEKGAPEGQCGPMIPSVYDHGNPQPAIVPIPYEIQLSSTTYKPGQQITLTLRSSSSKTFKGFLVEVRKKDGTSKTVGSLTGSGAAGQSSCTNGGFTHKDNAVKTDVIMTWTAPNSDQGALKVVGTVVQDKKMHWDAKELGTITPEQGVTFGTDPPIQTTPMPPGPNTVTYDAECGKTKGCFTDCTASGGSCGYLVTWQQSGDSIDFMISGSATTSRYIAIGFSEDDEMGRDSVIMCVYDANEVNLIQAYNPPTNGTDSNEDKPSTTTPRDIQTLGISMIRNTYYNGVLTCKFSRLIASTHGQVFNLDTDYYLLFARGSIVDGAIIEHDDEKESKEKIDFNKYKSTPVTVARKSACGTTTGCLHDCDAAGVCSYIIQWAKNGDNTDFTITADSENNRYIAIGFSKDEKMGDDSVMSCDTAGNIFNSFNTGRGSAALPAPNDVVGINNTKYEYKDGIITCSFSRQTAVSGVSEIYDLNTQYFMLVARGPTQAVTGRRKRSTTHTVSKHDVPPVVSSSKVDFQSVTDLMGTVDTMGPKLVKAHACLMITAWICFATIGIVCATWYKMQWPNTKFAGLHAWFQVHRTCMVLVFLCSCAGFIIIFVNEQEWSDINPADGIIHKYHPVFGTICVGLTIINPFMAMCRPGPKAEKRLIFNVAHWIVGVAAHALGIVAIFGGIRMDDLTLPHYVLYMLYAFVAWYAFVMFWLQINKCYEERAGRSDEYEMREVSNDPRDKVHTKSSAGRSFKQFLFFMNVIVCLGLATALIVIILLNNK